MLRKVVCLLLVLFLVCGSKVYGEVVFNDVSEGHYAYEGMMNIGKKCRILGDGNGNFYPERKISREAFWLIMINLYDSYRVEDGKESLRENEESRFCFQYEFAPFQSYNFLGLCESNEWSIGMVKNQKFPRWLLWKTVARITEWNPKYYIEDKDYYDMNLELIKSVKDLGIYKEFPDPYDTPTRGEVVWFINEIMSLPKDEENLSVYGYPVKVINWEDATAENYHYKDNTSDRSSLYIDMYLDKNTEWFYAHSLVYALNHLPEKYVKQFVKEGWRIKVTRDISNYFNKTINGANRFNGLTIYEYDTIWISTSPGEPHLGNTFYHEFGHYVSDLMPNEDKYLMDMFKERENDKDYKSGRVLRSYARVNYDEYFADCFSYLIRSNMKDRFYDEVKNEIDAEVFKSIFPKTYDYIQGCWIDGKIVNSTEEVERVYLR